ncbi:MAG: response regulator transcription factor [Mycoplasmatales bacterium]
MRILIVDDEFELANIYRKVLTGYGKTADIALDLKAAKQKFLAVQYDLILLDMNLTDGSGIELLEEIRLVNKKIPIIIISAQNIDTQIAKTLKIGADDYMVKPVNYDVLDARISAVIRRNQAEITNEKVIGKLVIDYSNRRIMYDKQPIILTNKEYEIFLIIVSTYPDYCSTEMIVEKSYDEYFDPSSTVLRVHISKLKKKLNQAADYELLFLKRGWGYNICAEKPKEK